MSFKRYQELLVYRALIEKLLKHYYEKELGSMLDFRLRSKEFTENRMSGHRRQEFRRPDLRCQDVFLFRIRPDMSYQQLTFFLDTIKERVNFFILFVDPNIKFATSIKVLIDYPRGTDLKEFFDWYQDGDDVCLDHMVPPRTRIYR